MTKVVAIVPSYDRARDLVSTLDGIERVVKPDDVFTMVQPKDQPLGVGEARRRLCRRAIEKHGDEIVILSLDDDSRFIDGECNVRWAAELFAEHRDLGIVQMPNRRGPARDKQTDKPYLYHAFLIRGALIREGIEYTHEYADEVDLSLRAWLAGWRCVVTQRARILHRVTARGVRDPRGGGREAAYLDGLVSVRSTFVRDYVETGLVTCKLGVRDGVVLPTPYASVRVTAKAREVHAQAARRRGFV